MIVKEDDRKDQTDRRLGELWRRDPCDPGNTNRAVTVDVPDDRHREEYRRNLAQQRQTRARSIHVWLLVFILGYHDMCIRWNREDGRLK